MTFKRASLVVCICLLTAFGCKNSSEHNRSSVDRSKLVAALNEFKNTLHTNDSNRVYSYLPKKIIQDSYFETDDVINSCKDFFDHLEIDLLKSSDTISSRIISTESPCKEIFVIAVGKDSISFEYRMDKNPDYKMTEKDVADELDQSSLCEHITWYNFKMIQGKLKLTSLGGAD